MICLDTHALLWWALAPEKLSVKARELCQQMEREKGYASSISIWEIGVKIKNGSLDIGMDLNHFTRLLNQTQVLELVPVSTEIWLHNLALDWAHRDPADRTIVATAQILDVPLLTKDKEIQDFIPQKAIW
jgi:PIN domain nuclease of toxin-antitoxin system